MADFREELHITRSKDQFGKPSWFPYYDYCRTKTDLSDNTVEIIDFKEKSTISEVVEAIDSFAPSEYEMKKYIKLLLNNDELNVTDEY